MSGVTVCMTARNAAQTIAQSLRSLIRCGPHVEAVLVRDDGSTDSTKDAVAEVRDSRVRILHDDSPVGIPDSRNAVLAEVETEYVACLDADDIALPWRFRRQFELIRDDRADIVFSTVIDRKQGTPLVKPQLLPRIDAAAAPYHLLVENPFMNPTMLARTATIRELGGFRRVASEDYDLWLRAAAAGMGLVRDAVPAVIYRHHPSQTTHQGEWIRSRSQNPLVEEAFNDLANRALGFVPSWFQWRRDGFPAGRAPASTRADLDAFDAHLRRLCGPSRSSLQRRVRYIRRRAAL